MKRIIITLILILGISQAYSQEFKFKSGKQLINNIYGDLVVDQLDRYFIYNKEENKLYEYTSRKFETVGDVRELDKVWAKGDWRYKCSLITSNNARQGESFLVKGVDSFTGQTFTVEITVTKYYEQ